MTGSKKSEFWNRSGARVETAACPRKVLCSSHIPRVGARHNTTSGPWYRARVSTVSGRDLFDPELRFRDGRGL